MAEAYQTAMPPELDLPAGYTVRLTAINPTTGAVVNNVTVSHLLMLTLPIGGTVPTDLAFGEWQLVPGAGA